MSIKLTIDKTAFDALNDQQKPLYIEKDGSYVLDVEGGAVAQADFDAQKTTIEELKGQVNGPDGKSWKDMFEGSQNANKAIRGERDGFEGELKKWQALGKLEDVQKQKDELDAFRKKGEGLDALQKENTELKGSVRSLTDERDNLKTQAENLTKERDELAKFKTEAEKLTAFNKAQEQITAEVEKLEGANKRAMNRSLIERYIAGELIFDDKGNLFCKSKNQSLAAYAKEYLEDYQLFAVAPNTPGKATPPNYGGPGGQGTGVVDAASISALLGLSPSK